MDWRGVNYAAIQKEDRCLSEFRERIEAAIPALRRYARALTRDAETADDIVQDTLVRALRSEHLFHGGDMRAWLYTILTNLNRNRLRTLARRPVVTPIKDTDATTNGPDSGGRDIVRALEMLTEEQRSALLLVSNRSTGTPVIGRESVRIAKSWWLSVRLYPGWTQMLLIPEVRPVPTSFRSARPCTAV